MKLVYICSPYAGSIEENVRFAKAACRYAMKQGCAPIAPHLLYPQFLNDAVPMEREAGIRMGLRVLASCEELWVCGNHTSEGMEKEIAEAKRLGIPVRRISAEQIQKKQAIRQYGILARRSALSVCGSAEAWVKQDGEPVTFDTYEEAATEAGRLNEGIGPVNRTVEYFPQKRSPLPEETLVFGMSMRL
ncbi:MULTISPECIES: DUF4406 domain-containing protein [Caproicibacterium]|mgnify:FL=1|uniref:DUF4406 domain-containing protein n=1 Tax=Caproicibacterium lactatifermentans TaxID=2666138 RepID=A0A859DPQ1_9FIRM|nr:DUF4406 domain-containing protein [Caproicibacterium lactatifermentans]QKN24057.1 DUF4406 domain-containing protein [Caproicibacterium lactatifermentans]QKO30872.1 DUF4406 domain-containing protein [Caproicibacterium lactatifermentans]